MWLRDQRVPRVSVGSFVRDDQRAEASLTEVHPFEVAGDYDAQLAISLRVPHCRHLYWPPDHDDDHGTLWLVDPGSGAWASLRHHPRSDGRYEVPQYGPRRLWDEVEAAYRWWREAGDPKAADWRFTVAPDTQRVKLNPRTWFASAQVHVKGILGGTELGLKRHPLQHPLRADEPAGAEQPRSQR